MRIVVLDGATAAGNDLSFDALRQFGELEVYDYTEPELIVSRAENADIIVTNKSVLSRERLELLPRCRLIAETATGVDNIDLQAAKSRGIIVSNVPAYSTDAVAQHTMALLLGISNHASDISRAVKKDGWVAAQKAHYADYPMFELAGKTLGLLGFGNIGKRVAAAAGALGMRVIACASRPFTSDLAECVALNELLRRSDILSLHAPLTDETRLIINAQNIERLQRGAILINTARGRLIDETALLCALQSGQISFFAADVLYDEPAYSNELIGRENTMITPHIAWCPSQTRQRLIDITVQNIKAFVNGKAINIIK